MSTHSIHRGFTLLEVLLYLSLAMIMLAVLSRIGVDVLEGRTKIEAEENAIRNAQMAYETIRYTLQDAKSIVYPEAGNSSSTLQLEVGEDREIVTFRVLDQKVAMQDELGNVSYLTDFTSNVSLQFSNLLPQGEALLMQIDVFASNERDLQFERASTSLSTTVTLR